MSQSKMVILKPVHTFGIDKQIYVAGQSYKMDRKDIPAVKKGSYKIKDVKTNKPAKDEAPKKDAKKDVKTEEKK